jgi:hypothetical protein
MSDLAPVYDTSAWRKATGKGFTVDASDLTHGKGTPTLWGWAKGYENAGAWFKSHKTGRSVFFEVIGRHTVNGTNDVQFWNLKCRQHDFLLTVFND